MFLQKSCTVIKCHENKYKMWYFVFETERIEKEKLEEERRGGNIVYKWTGIHQKGGDPKRTMQKVSKSCLKKSSYIV